MNNNNTVLNDDKTINQVETQFDSDVLVKQEQTSSIQEEEVDPNVLESYLYIIGESKHYGEMIVNDALSSSQTHSEIKSLENDLDTIMDSLSLPGTLKLRRLLKDNTFFCRTELERDFIKQVVEYINHRVATGFYEKKEGRQK